MGILIKTKEELASLHAQINGSLVLTNGCFDILHVGHVRYLQEARKLGDVLLVAVNSDKSVKDLKGSTRPINSELDRAEVLNALGCVDYTFIFDEFTADEVIKTAKPNIYVKGGDYHLENLPERDSILAVGCRACFLAFHEGFSTTGTINKMKN